MARPSCNATKGERVIRGFIALVIASFAVSLAETSIFAAIVVGIVAALVAVMAITGFCPGSWVQARTLKQIEEQSFQFTDARSHVELNSPTK